MAYYKSVKIRYHDEEETLPVVVSVDQEWNEIEDEEDARIFFYFASEQEYEQAKQTGDNGFEFCIVEEN